MQTTQEKPRDDGKGRDLRDAAKTQEMPRTAQSQQKPEETREALP